MEKINEAYYLLIDLEKQDSYIGVSNQSDGNVQKLIPYVWENYRKAIIIITIVLIGSIILFFPTETNNNINIVFFGKFVNTYDFIRALKNRNMNNEIELMNQKNNDTGIYTVR